MRWSSQAEACARLANLQYYTEPVLNWTSIKLDNVTIETYAYARAGLLGNPSDGYYGKTIAFLVRNFRARVLLYPSARLEIKPGKADMPVFESMDDLYRSTRWRGYYGGIRIIQALIVRFLDYCKEQGIPIEERNFTLE